MKHFLDHTVFVIFAAQFFRMSLKCTWLCFPKDKHCADLNSIDEDLLKHYQNFLTPSNLFYKKKHKKQHKKAVFFFFCKSFACYLVARYSFKNCLSSTSY